MKVLFVVSGNKSINNGVSSFINVQYDSLLKAGIDMRMYPQQGHGLWGYIKNAMELRQFIRKEKPDIVHAHYKYCLFLTVLATRGLWYRKNGRFMRPRIYMSVMGGFPNGGNNRNLTRFFIDHYCDGALAKSQQSADELDCKKIKLSIVPNGVNLEKLQIEEKKHARKELGLDEQKKYVLWPTYPDRYQKNYPLAEGAMKIVKNAYGEGVELLVINNVAHDTIVKYMCAADIVLSTSRWEGSPNAIKEALALNCPIVATIAGDIPWLIDGVEGCLLVTENSSEKVAESILATLQYGRRTEGRKQIERLQLTVEQVAYKIIAIYKSLIDD